MKIAIIFPKDSEAIFDKTSSRTFGGATVYLFAMANEFVKNKGQDIFCLTPKIKNKDSFKNLSLKIIEVFNVKKTIFDTIYLFHRTIQTEKPDVIIQHGLTIFSCLLSLYCKIFKIKFIFMFAHDVEVEGKYQTSRKNCTLFNLLLNTATVLITQNKYQQDYLFNKKGIKSVLIYTGFPVRELKKITREIILWMARCETWKQPELFIRLAQNYPDKKFVMVCPKVDEQYFNSIKDMAKKVKNIDFIDFVPFKNTWDYFERAKVFVNTSVSEGFPLVFVQSVTCGVPIISLNVNPDNFITNNKCGFVCGGDENFLNLSLKNIFVNKELYEEYSLNAYKYAQNKHDIGLNVNKLLDLMK
jgi:glycosyltransferase involved in cell wall biosynthesis